MLNRRLLVLLPLCFVAACTSIKRCAYEGIDRAEWQKPAEVIASLGIEPGARVADLGAGSGYFTFSLAEAVGDDGRVFAVDVDEDMLAELDARIAEENRSNVETVRASPEDARIPDPGVDLVFTVNTYHHIEDRPAYFERLAKSLSPTGRLAVIDFDAAYGLFHRLFSGSHWVDPEIVKAELAEAGYRMVDRHEFLPRQSFTVWSFGEEKAPANEESVKPGINDAFLSEDLDVEEWLARFEVESREIFLHREVIADTVQIEEGMAVADIGAGTGVFLAPFHERVGATGKIYATDISPRFLAHLRDRVTDEKLTRVEVIEGGERSVELPPASVDVAFVCDVYHHFEYPEPTLASLFSAIRPGGHLVVIDFERISGVTADWILNHVRAGKAVFRSEIEAAGFVLDEEVGVPGLKENYFLRFRRP